MPHGVIEPFKSIKSITLIFFYENLASTLEKKIWGHFGS